MPSRKEKRPNYPQVLTNLLASLGIFRHSAFCLLCRARHKRHTFASLLAIAGVSIFKIAQWLGDDVRVVERHYAHLLPQDLDIERAFGKEPSPAQKEAGIDEAR
jgi:hypothetical protein